jgi:hypothetical protein
MTTRASKAFGGFHVTPSGALHVADGVRNFENPYSGDIAAVPRGRAVRLTATGPVSGSAEEGALVGFYVASTTSGTLVLKDGGGSGTQLTGTITPAVGWHWLPLEFGESGGLHATIGGTALDVTLIYRGA